MKNPTECILWARPEALKGELFEALEAYRDESHWSRGLFKCRECGQLYFHEFYEIADWDGGDDSQYSLYIPIESASAAAVLDKEPPLGLMQYSPRLQRDFPKGAKAARIVWIR